MKWHDAKTDPPSGNGVVVVRSGPEHNTFPCYALEVSQAASLHVDAHWRNLTEEERTPAPEPAEKPIPCPWCGTSCKLPDDGVMTWVQCKNIKCVYTSPCCPTPAEAIRQHNRIRLEPEA